MTVEKKVSGELGMSLGWKYAVDAMGEFWTGVWGVEGAYEEGSEALRQWRHEVKRQVCSAPEMAEPDRGHAFNAAVGKQAG